MGLFEGVTYSALFTLWSVWVPPCKFKKSVSKLTLFIKIILAERSRMVMASVSGNYVGLVISLPASGLLAANAGWEWVFYIFGIIGCIWTVAWILLVKRSPATDPFISEDERKYIERSLSGQSKDKDVKIPWLAIWTSSAVWAIIGTTSTKLDIFIEIIILITFSCTIC
jgi:MFS transporter, ACS family, solute carrier family 17 (sodium-dependent inorganic phosphate cotransporter), other